MTRSVERMAVQTMKTEIPTMTVVESPAAAIVMPLATALITLAPAPIELAVELMARLTEVSVEFGTVEFWKAQIRLGISMAAPKLATVVLMAAPTGSSSLSSSLAITTSRRSIFAKAAEVC